MSASNASYESDDTMVSDEDLANSLKKNHEKSSGESDEEELVIYPECYQTLWTLKLDPDDNKYLKSEVDKLIESPFWYKKVFHIPKIPRMEEVVEGVPRMISLRRCKARLRNRVAVYDMVAATEALRDANDQTLKCLFENRPGSLKWVREWLELSDLVFRRIVDADSQKRGVGKDEDTRQIFKKMLDEKEVFWTPKVLSYSGIDEYKHRSQGHKITKDKDQAIDEWRYPGWLKGKPPPHRLFHDMLIEPEHKSSRKEAIRKLEDGRWKDIGGSGGEEGATEGPTDEGVSEEKRAICEDGGGEEGREKKDKGGKEEGERGEGEKEGGPEAEVMEGTKRSSVFF